MVDIAVADTLLDGWRLWSQWQEVIAPDNLAEIEALQADHGDYLGYVRVVGRRRPDVQLPVLITSVPNAVCQATAAPLRPLSCGPRAAAPA